MIIAYKYTISGRVQGVGFRYFTEIVARRLHITGYVKNLYNRNVEAYAIGTEEQLRLFENELRRGPSAAYVEEVKKVVSPVDESVVSFRITF